MSARRAPSKTKTKLEATRRDGCCSKRHGTKPTGRSRDPQPGRIRTVIRIYRHRPEAIEGESNGFITSSRVSTERVRSRATGGAGSRSGANDTLRPRSALYLEDSGGAADLVHVLHDVLARGLEVRDEGHAVGHSLEVVEGELMPTACAMAMRWSTVLVTEDGLMMTMALEGGAGHDVPGLEVNLEQMLDRLTRHEALSSLSGPPRGWRRSTAAPCRAPRWRRPSYGGVHGAARGSGHDAHDFGAPPR